MIHTYQLVHEFLFPSLKYITYKIKIFPQAVNIFSTVYIEYSAYSLYNECYAYAALNQSSV